jgi:hypothetical protein
MKRRSIALCLLVSALAQRPAEAAVVDLELDSLGTYTTDLFAACSMGAVTETANGLLSFGPLGLGVSSPSGGLSAYLDGSENLTFFFSTVDQVGVTGVTYRVQSAGNQNGTGPPGEAFLEARGASNVDLGIRSVSGIGTIDVSALYGGVPITRIEITAAGDSQRVDRLGFTVAPEAAFSIVSLQGFPVLQVVEYDICDLFLSGSHPIRLAPVGLGVASANPPSLLDSTIEGAEFVRFDFATPFTEVGYTNEAVADGNANGTLAESFVEAFGPTGASLGIVGVSGEGQQVVSELFGSPISAFRVIANADSQRILTVIYGPEPDALVVGVAALAALGLAARWRGRGGAIALAALALGVADPAAAQGTAYEIAIVARAGDAIGGKTLTNVFAPALNDAGEIAFRGQFSGGSGIFTPNALVAEVGQSVGGKTIVTLNGPALRPDGAVVFFASHVGGSGLFTAAGQLFGAGDTIGAATINEVNSLPRFDASGAPLARVGFSDGSTALATPAAIRIAEGDDYGGRIVERFLGTEPAPIDASGVVSAVVEFEDGGEAIVTQSALLVAEGDSVEGVEIAEILNNVDRDDAGTIVFSATLAAGGSGLFTQDAILAVTGDAIDGRSITSFGAPAIDVGGVVAFHGQYDAGGPRAGIFTLTDEVIALFETTIGAETVSGLVADRPALNASGQIAVKAIVGVSPAILLATPVPEAATQASGLAAFGALRVCLATHGRRRSRPRPPARV